MGLVRVERVGLFWDNSFYGNLEAYDGMKLAPEYGASLEGTLGSQEGARYFVQFFPIDGRTNLSLADRDTVSVPGARRRNEAVARVEPFFRLSSTIEFALGVSAEYFRADFVDNADDVYRFAVDVKETTGPLVVWAEYLRQEGFSVTDFPYPGSAATPTAPAVLGRASAHNNYTLIGAEYRYGNLAVRYNLSFAAYTDVSVTEWLHVPGIGYAFNSHLGALVEFALWQRYKPEGASIFDRSVNVTLTAGF